MQIAMRMQNVSVTCLSLHHGDDDRERRCMYILHPVRFIIKTQQFLSFLAIQGLRRGHDHNVVANSKQVILRDFLPDRRRLNPLFALCDAN